MCYSPLLGVINMNKKALKIFGSLLCLCSFSLTALAQSDSIIKHDTTWFSGGGGHITVQMFLTKEPQTFYYTYRDDLWVRLTQGTYEISNDSIYLSCTSNCEEWKGSVLGPIIVENQSNVEDEGVKFSFVSTAEKKVDNFKGKLIDDPEGKNSKCGKYIEITHKDSVVYLEPLKNCSSNRFSVHIPVDMLDPQLVTFKKKTGIIKDGKILFNEFTMTYTPLNHPIETENKKKKKRKKKK